MLTFLRKIRKALIESSSASKYLLYAIGEIALVVIGILIALQINNWNEWRKERYVENKILTQIESSLENDLQEFKRLISRMDKKASSITAVLDMINDDKETSKEDYLAQSDGLTWSLTLSNDRGAYETIKSLGLEKIVNDSLRTVLIRYYEATLPRAAIRLQELEEEYEPKSDQIRDDLIDEGLLAIDFTRRQDSTWTYNLDPNLPRLLKHSKFQTLVRYEIAHERGNRRILKSLVSQTEKLLEHLKSGSK